jgi:hypothetical protein
MDRSVGLAQGVYYVITGAWPLVSMGTFERLTGRKSDRWLVKTVGLLMVVIGAVLARPAPGTQRDHSVSVTPADDRRVLGAGSAASLAAIDVYYTMARRISPIYLLDAVLEVGFLTAWLRRARPAGRR